MPSTAYTTEFYNQADHIGLQSARIVIPLIAEIVQPSSVVDVGCGRGAWLSVCQDLGVDNVLGLDGDWVEQNRLLISPARFQTVDLARRIHIERTFDLAICLEVAEHLPARMAVPLVDQLTTAAPVVMFSAAVPGQDGTHHINEQWHSYWHRLFSDRGFTVFDVIRPQIALQQEVAWWIRQNAFLYVSASAPQAVVERLSQQCQPLDLEWIHPRILHRLTTCRGLWHAALAATARAIRARLP